MTAGAPGAATYVYPAIERVHHGAGAVGLVESECSRLGAQSVLLLTTGSLRDSQALGAVLEALGERRVTVLSGSAQHVPLDAVAALIEQAGAAQPDLIVSLGGGSVIDSAKALAAALPHGYQTGAQLYRHRIVFTPPDTIEQQAFDAEPLPQIAIPTTLSAAEHDGIFGMTYNGTKDLYADPRLAPRIVVLDPAVTVETPPALWASSGIRALDHAVELYLSRAPSPLTDAACLHAVRLLSRALRASVEDPEDLTLRLLCQHASWLSMFGVENVTLGLCHGIGHQIGARCGVPHGITSCVMLPTVLRAMVEVMPQRMAELLIAMDESAATRPVPELAAELPDRVAEMIAGLGLPGRLSEVGVTEEDFEQIAHDSVHDFVVSSAPIAVGEDDIVRLLRQAL